MTETKQDLDISDSMKSRYGCSDMLCNNNGRCYKFYGGFVCFCQNGFTGKYCGNSFNTLTIFKYILCNNNGRCYKFYRGFVCFYQKGFTGKYCGNNVLSY